MIYYIDYKKNQENNAGNKAPDDVAKICRELQYSQFLVPSLPKDYSPLKSRIWILLHAPIWWRKLKKTVTEEDVVIYQHPMYGSRLALQKVKEIKESKGCRFIALIHDLESLRNGVEGEYKVKESTSNIADNQLLKLFDKVICHNEHMMDYLISKGFNKEQLINLEIFDYLCDAPFKEQNQSLSKPEIAIAGNLNWGKSRYVYELGSILRKESNITINVYGNKFDKSKATDTMCYKGSFRPDDLPGILEGNFGLVWDGVSAESCVGNTGEYLRYNDPHKTSLYIASGIPIIVWREAAIADFVISNGIGITVDSLYDIEEAIKSITKHDYDRMRDNTIALGRKIRDGYFTKKALKNAIYERGEI